MFALHLPHSGGVCLRDFPEAIGQRVAGREGAPHPRLAHLETTAALEHGIPGPPAAGSGPRLAELGGVAVVVSGGGTARALLWEGAFASWWRGRAPAPARAAAAAWIPPLPSPQDSALASVEGRLLAHLASAGLAEDAGAPDPSTLALLRRERRGGWAPEREAAEQGLEVLAGVACYVGWRCAGGVPPVPDPLGPLADPARARVVGALLCHLLELLRDQPAPPRRLPAWAEAADARVEWRQALMGGQVSTLDQLLERHVRFAGGSRDDARIRAACERWGYDTLLAEARETAARAAEARAQLVGRILRGPGTLLTFATGDLGPATVVPVEPPQPVNAGLTLHAAGARFEYPDGTRLECPGLPLAEDRHGGLVHVRVSGRLRFGADGQPLEPDHEVAFSGGLDLRVGPLRASARRGSLRPIDGGWLVRLTPA